MSDQNSHADLRDGVRAVCNQFDNAYWQQIDEARGYPEAFVKVAGTEVLDGRCWTAPTLAGGKLFVRNEKELVSLDMTTGATVPGDGRRR